MWCRLLEANQVAGFGAPKAGPHLDLDSWWAKVPVTCSRILSDVPGL